MMIGHVGARLIAASIPLYALGVAIAVFVAWQPDPSANWWSGPYAGGIAAFVATAVLVAGGAAARAFSRRWALVAGGIAAALVVVWIVAIWASNVWVFYMGIFAWFVLVQLALVAYPVLFWTLWREASELAARAVLRSAAFTIAVLLAPVALAPRYFPEAGEARNAAVMATASLVAVIGAVTMARGIPALTLSSRALGLSLAALVFIQLGLVARGLPNPPMTFARAPSVTIEYPADQPDLASDTPAFAERLALIVSRSGAQLPPGGVYVRYRWSQGPDGIPPPADTLVVPMWLDGVGTPAHRLRDFAERTVTTLFPQPRTVYNAYAPWSGYIQWVSVPDDADTRDRLARACDWLVNRQQHINPIETAPYVRLERTQGVEGPRALYARLAEAPPSNNDWAALVMSGCQYVLSTR